MLYSPYTELKGLGFSCLVFGGYSIISNFRLKPFVNLSDIRIDNGQLWSVEEYFDKKSLETINEAEHF